MRKLPVPLRVAIVGVATVTTAAACGSSKSSGSSDKGGTKSVQASGSKSAADDVTVTACANDTALDLGSATVRITNHSSKTSNYIIEVTANSADGATQVDSGMAAANNLAPGQSTDQTAQFTKSLPAGSTCKVANVTRYAS